MANKLRLRILTRLAQTQPNQPETTKPTLAPPPAVGADLFSNLPEGYNAGTVTILTDLMDTLNIALHYSSAGKDNFNKISGNNLDMSGVTPDEKNIAMIAERIYNTFLNQKNPFAGKKVTTTNINNWANALLTSPEYAGLAQINPTSELATKLGGNLRDLILNYMNQIKQNNPIST